MAASVQGLEEEVVLHKRPKSLFLRPVRHCPF
jgi:hypothetical protein